MFRTFKAFRTHTNARRIALIVAPLAVLGAVVSTASAGGGGGGGGEPWWHRSSRRPAVVIHAEFPGPRVVISRPVECVDEVPAGLQMQAYQSKDRVIIVINGTNRGAGFRTALTAAGDGRSEFLVLHNSAPYEGCREGACSFTVTAAICASRELSRVCVRIGDRSFDVPVTCVPSIG